MLHVVVRYADGWNTTSMPVETYIHKRDVLKNNCRELGVDYDAVIKSLSNGSSLDTKKRL